MRQPVEERRPGHSLSRCCCSTGHSKGSSAFLSDRQQTDVHGIALLFLGLCGLAAVHNYFTTHRNLQRLFGGYNRDGKLCGIDEPGPLLYWCPDAAGGIVLNGSVCVETCPVDTTGLTPCMDPVLEVLTNVPTYRTVRIAQMCFPANKTLSRWLWNSAVGENGFGTVWRFYNTLASSWVLVCIGMGLGVLVSYAYVKLLSSYSEVLLRVSMFFLVLGPLFLGFRYVQQAFQEKSDESSSVGTDMFLGCSLMFFSFVMTFVTCCFKGVQTAVGCIEAASDLFFQESSIIIVPFISLLSKFAILAYLGYGVLLLVSCGEIERGGTYGILRTLNLTTGQILRLAYFIFMLGWLLELSNSLMEYAVAWMSAKWYFTPLAGKERKGRAKGSGIVPAVGHALRYHLGSIALGSLIIFLLRPARLTLGAATKMSYTCIRFFGAAVMEVFAVLESVYKELIACWDRCAFFEVAIRSKPICKSAVDAADTITNEVPAVATLRGAHLILLFAGLCMSGFLPALIVFLICLLGKLENWDTAFNPNYPKYILIATTGVCLSIGLSFMTVFDTVADTILYCFALDQRRIRRIRKRKRQQRQKASGTFQDGWDTSSSDTDSQTEGLEANDLLDVTYAPYKLRKLVSEQEDTYH